MAGLASPTDTARSFLATQATVSRAGLVASAHASGMPGKHREAVRRGTLQAEHSGGGGLQRRHAVLLGLHRARGARAL